MPQRPERRIRSDYVPTVRRRDPAESTINLSLNHSEILNVTSDQHHAQDHASRHAVGGADALSGYANLTTNQTIAGVKTFSSIPVLPASDPTTSNQATRKSYVDTQVATKIGSSGVTYENLSANAM
jgi:hypothetical protein